MFETDPKKLKLAALAGSQALNGLDELLRCFLVLKGTGSSDEVLKEVESGTASLHILLRMRSLEWGLSCSLERNGSSCDLTGPRKLSHVHFCRVMMNLVDFARDKVGDYRLQRVQKGSMWLFFDVTIRGQVAQIDAFTARRARPADRHVCVSAGFIHDPRGMRL